MTDNDSNDDTTIALSRLPHRRCHGGEVQGRRGPGPMQGRQGVCK